MPDDSEISYFYHYNFYKMRVIILFVFLCFSVVYYCQSVRIGKYVVSTEDLKVTRFNNGDEIPLFKSEEEAKKYVKEGKPACIKVGNSIWYNWYAANDKRGIAPAGWYIPNSREFNDFIYTCRENIHSVINHKNKTILPGEATGKENQEPFFRWWIGGEIKEFADPMVEILKCESRLGPLSTTTVKKTDFYPVRLFDKNTANSSAQIYFTKQKVFRLKNDTLDWSIVIESENCDWGNDENSCYGRAKIRLQNKKDESNNYTIEVDDFIFSINKRDEIISDLGLRFDDFNFDGQKDFGFGFDNDMYDGLLPKVYLMSQDGKRFEYNKEFNKLIQGPSEISSFDLAERKFEQISTFPDGYEYVEYYLCPKDSLKKFNKYEFPSELEGYKINYPDVYLVKYFNKFDSEVEKFDFFDHVPFTTKTLNEIEKGEFDESYIFNFENTDISNFVEKIDSTTFYKAYENVVPNPFLLKEKEIASELKRINENKAFVSKKRNELQIECVNKEKLYFKNLEESGESFVFYGQSEDNNYWIIRQFGEYDSHSQILINKATCKLDSIDGFPRISPDGTLAAIGEYIEEEGAFGYLKLYKKDKDKLIEIGSVLMDDLEYSFAPYELFWVDNKTLYVKKLKTKGFGENDYYFEYGKITVDYFNSIKK